MSKKKRCVMTVMSILLMMALVAAAFFAPERLGTWYDDRTIGKAEYADMVYEPYQIYCYDSFSEKLDVIAGYLAQGNVFPSRLEERGEKVSDAQLLDYVNEELEKMGELKLIPQGLYAKNLVTRRLLELYVIVDATAGNENYVSNIRYWQIQCETGDGALTVAMDQEYHKLYGVQLSVKNAPDQKMQIWENTLENRSRPELAAAWEKYWELDDIIAENNGTESGNTSVFGKDVFDGAANGTVFCQLVLSSGVTVSPVMELYLYDNNGGYANCGLLLFL